MNEIERRIEQYLPAPGTLAIYWLGGAGFVLKSAQCALGIDLYLSDALRDGERFKRILPPPAAPENLRLDLLIASHEHGDHLDTGSLISLMGKNTRLLGPDSALCLARELGVPEERLIPLNRGGRFEARGVSLRAVPADHGDLSPQAIGMILNMEGVTVYFSGDTRYREDFCDMIGLREKIDVLIAPINDAYGNPGPDGAARIARAVGADAVLPCHYWLFPEHGGDPGKFLESCRRIAPRSRPFVQAVGEGYVAEGKPQ